MVTRSRRRSTWPIVGESFAQRFEAAEELWMLRGEGLIRTHDVALTPAVTGGGFQGAEILVVMAVRRQGAQEQL